VFILVLVLAAGFFALNVQRLVKYMRLGVPENRVDQPGKRLLNVLRVGIAQTKILREPIAGFMHAFIFWGFIVLTAGTVEILVQGLVAGFTYERFLPRPAFLLYSMSQDAFAMLVLGAIAFAYYRRLVLHPRRLEGDHIEHADAYIILGMIAGLMVTLLLANAFLAVARPGSVGAEKMVSLGIASALRGLSASTAFTWYRVFWWAHVLLVLTFLNYLPYSKHLHVVTSLINVFFSNTTWKGERDRKSVV